MLTSICSRARFPTARFFAAAAPQVRTEREKMLAGELYRSDGEELVGLRLQSRILCREFNLSDPLDVPKRQKILSQLFHQPLENVLIEPPLNCDYGRHTTLGKNVFMNFNCCILDVCEVKIGDNTMFGPFVQLMTAAHPLDADLRVVKWLEFGHPITIGKACWLGSGAIVCPGVTLGDNVVVAAGAVVTKSFPSNCVIAGNPARIIKQLEPQKSQAE
jgi:maltose O-acetyltransferase